MIVNNVHWVLLPNYKGKKNHVGTTGQYFRETVNDKAKAILPHTKINYG